MILARTISDDALVTVNTLELLGIIYLAIAISMLRERIARLEGKIEGRREEARRCPSLTSSTSGRSC